MFFFNVNNIYLRLKIMIIKMNINSPLEKFFLQIKNAKMRKWNNIRKNYKLKKK